MKIRLTKPVARKVLSVVDHPDGLVRGLGKPEPGKFCVEAAVSYALGLGHNAEPPCVGHAVRAFKIQLNDCSWSSNQARAKGMRRLAVAQLGSDKIDQMLGENDRLLILTAEVGIDCLKELKSPGCKWLDICSDLGSAARAQSTPVDSPSPK